MPHYRATVGSNGTIALPTALHETLQIEEGRDVEFFLTAYGDVLFRAITASAKDWAGRFGVEVRSPLVSIKEMDDAIGEEVTEDNNRTLRQGGQEKRPSRPRAAE